MIFLYYKILNIYQIGLLFKRQER